MRNIDSIAQFIYPPAQAGETETMRLNRAILVVMATATSLGGIIWGTVYLLLGVSEVSIWPYGYVVFSFLNLLVYLRNRKYEVLLFGQLLLILTVPTLLQWAMGGYAASGAVILWAFLAPIVALVVSQSFESARGWFYAYFGLVVVSGIMEQTLAQYNVGMPDYGVTMFFVMNITAPLLTTYFIVQYFIRVGREAEAEVRLKTTELEKANKTLQQFTISLEDTVRQRTQELRDALQVAETASHTKSLFLANMSHELRTPLNAIIGYSEMLREDAEEFGYEDTIPDLDKIRTAGKHLLALINDILDISKIESGKMEMHLEEFPLHNLLQDVVMTVTPLVQQNHNTISLDMPESLGQIVNDSTRLRQIVLNLISNAAKFTENGTITVRASREMVDDRDMLEIAIQDTGIGMTLDQADKVFSEFVQADLTTTRKYGGTGLGLAITRHFCEMMGGGISVSSKVGEGSTFTVSIPAIVTPARTTIEMSPMQSVGGKPATMREYNAQDTTVLVIDDDATVHDLLTRQLEREGFVVISAYSAEEGLAKARTLKPSIITLDVMMPDKDGWTALAELKSDTDLHTIPVVMLSMLKDKSKGMLLGASDYLTKPVERNTLIGALNRFLPEKSDDPNRPSALIIEDDPTTRELFERTAQKQGYRTILAENGRIGLERLREHTPDLILLDIMMPEMDGMEFLMEMRAQVKWAQVPVIAITAKSLTTDEKDMLNRHTQNVLLKGNYQPEHLTEQLKMLLNAQKQRDT